MTPEVTASNPAQVGSVIIQAMAFATQILTLIGAGIGIWHISKKVQDVHISLNSRLDQLVAGARAQGAQDERDRNNTV